MNVLLIGSGGREHAIAWKLAQSKNLENLYIAPGNAGTANCGQNIAIAENDFEGIKKVVWEKSIDLVIVGPEAPLTLGIHDYFLADELLREIPVIGPQKDGALLEGSKDFSKIFMQEFNIPTAKYASFTSETLQNGYTFLEKLKPPYVLKADGLAAGKGVLILDKLEEAKNELKEMLNNSKFGTASQTVVIEEFLNGIECSVFVLTDGNNYKILPVAKDYKRIGINDTGLNTGGMGAVSPVSFANEMFMMRVEERVIKPTIDGLKTRGINYSGFIFIGLMNINGHPFVIEYNVRMGDPETEVVIPRIKDDLLELFVQVGNRTLTEEPLNISEKFAVTTMCVSEGYPEIFEKNKKISKLEDIDKNILVFHAATKLDNNNVVTNGGRVITLTAMHENLENAIALSQQAANTIQYDNKYFRNDIGKDIIELNKLLY